MDNTITLIISGIVMTGMVLLISPRVLAANKGVALRNIAIWVGIFLLLTLAYKTIGPGKEQPIIKKETLVKIQKAPSIPTEADGFSTAR